MQNVTYMRTPNANDADKRQRKHQLCYWKWERNSKYMKQNPLLIQ